MSLTTVEIERVLRTYVRGGVLTTMPRRDRQRQIVLEHVAQRLEPVRRYAEIDVDLELRQVWPDGVYWRIGGPVEI